MRVFALACCLMLIIPGLSAGPQGLDQAIKLYESGRFDQAADLLTAMSKSSPDNAEVRFWLGKALLKTRKWDDAVREMERAVALDRKNAVYYLWLGRACGARASHSSFLTAPGWAKRVLRSFEVAQEFAPDNLDVKFDLMTYYLDAPGFLGGGRSKADAEAAAIANLSPSAGYLARAQIFEKDKKWDEARLELVHAATLFPRDSGVLTELADFLLDRGDFDGAAEYACKALAADSDTQKAKLILAAADTRRGKDLAKAEKTLESMSQGPLSDDDPAFEEVFYWLGENYLAQDRRQQAREAFSAALRYDPDFDKARTAFSQTR